MSTLQRYKIGGEKTMPEDVKSIVCEVSRLRARVAGERILLARLRLAKHLLRSGDSQSLPLNLTPSPNLL
jgi:hypothetical protein